jgi:hypothetical protein
MTTTSSNNNLSENMKILMNIFTFAVGVAVLFLLTAGVKAHVHHHLDNDDDYADMHSHFDHRLNVGLGECLHDSECKYNEECFLEINEEKYTGVCRIPNPNRDMLLMHCKSNIDCPSKFECISTFDKTRGICEKKYEEYTEDVKAENNILLGDGENVLVPTSEKEKFSDGYQYDLVDDYFSSNIFPHIIEEESMNENDNDDHCGMSYTRRVVLREEPQEASSDDRADFFTQLYGLSESSLRHGRKLSTVGLEQCAAWDKVVQNWEKSCTNAEVRDSYIDKKLRKKSIEVVHAVFLNSKKQWPSKSRHKYDPLTKEDLAYQTKELNAFYNGTGLQFNARIATVVDDSMYNSYLTPRSASAIQTILLQKAKSKWYDVAKVSNVVMPINEYNYLRKGNKIQIAIMNRNTMEHGSVSWEIVTCDQLDGACNNKIKNQRTLRHKVKFDGTNVKPTQKIDTIAPGNGFAFLIVKSTLKNVIAQAGVVSTEQYVNIRTALDRFDYKSYGDVIFVIWMNMRSDNPNNIYGLNGFAGDFPGRGHKLPSNMGGIAAVAPKRAHVDAQIEGTSRPSTTLAHELGHVFGLNHVHTEFKAPPDASESEKSLICTCSEHAGQNVSFLDIVGDGCSDTPPQLKAKSRQCYSVDTEPKCGFKYQVGLKLDNLMSYSSCRSNFTPQQIGRMKCMLHNNAKLNAISGGVADVTSNEARTTKFWRPWAIGIGIAAATVAILVVTFLVVQFFRKKDRNEMLIRNNNVYKPLVSDNSVVATISSGVHNV